MRKPRPKARPPLPIVSAAAFDRVVRKMRMRPTNVECARRVLVDGERVIEVAGEYGVSRQRIYQIVERIRSAGRL